MTGTLRRRLLTVSMVMVWLIGIGAGLRVLLNHQTRPGAPATAPAHWPERTSLEHASDRATLVVVAHPRCPCTRATVSEVARLAARAQDRVRITVLFVLPKGYPSAWAERDLWHAAGAIPGVRVVIDPGAVEATRFGAHTSGQALLYDELGRLRFAGGLTPGRGHAGDNAGEDAIVALCAHDSSPIAATPVYGCALTSPTSPGKECRHVTPAN